MPEEVWKPIPSLPGYLASDRGRLMRAVPMGQRKKPRVMKCTRFDNGYLVFQTREDGRRIAHGLHRLVCEAFHGPCPEDGWHARHLDGDQSNNVPGNLAWGSPFDNAADRLRHETYAMGEAHHNAKATSEIVLQMFLLRAEGWSGLQISQRLGINRNTINKIIARTAWAHVPIPDEVVAKAHAVNARRAPPSERRAKRRVAGVPLLGGVA